ncbi:MFS transporter [Pseudomonas batumici]|uniref:Major facilitator family transporter n=1 Tax=Pseudomonas batumici TaxID=226910 RepID=A0A0C2E4G7_9PSED|nr:MFS transporter [Pseudomonas batumici]KIH80659.1 Major facilitator family transporter [Pseudomonas batumici]KIH82811.1 Major facilitator family transporter [Pseudomonas batumici]
MTGKQNAGRATAAATPERIPLAALLALTMASFIATANESVPAGLLPQIAQGFGISQAWAGQLVTLCALGSGLAAIPLTIALANWRRRSVLLLAGAAFLVCNAVTALSPYLSLTLLARFMVGIATGLAWSLLAGYARRMVPVPLQGRAMALAMLGIPLALAFGVPLSTWLGALLGWRGVFGVLSGLSLVLMLWVRFKVPDYPGQASVRRLPMRKVLNIPGVRPILVVMLFWIMAHYTLYTYIAPFLAALGLGDRLDWALLTFGVAALGGIWITGLLVDRWLRRLVLLSLGAFALVSLMLGFSGAPAGVTFIGIAVWGLSFGGSPTLLQTALADAAGDGADVAQSMLVTVFNLAFAASGVLGGLLLETLGTGVFPWVLMGMLLVALIVASAAKEHGFKAGRRASTRLELQ